MTILWSALCFFLLSAWIWQFRKAWLSYGSIEGGTRVFPGLYWMNETKWDARSPKYAKRLTALRSIYGEQAALSELVKLEASWRTQVGMALPIALLILYADWMLGILGAVLVFLLFYRVDYDLKRKVREREQQIENDLPQVLTKLILLLRAGMIAQEAFAQVANTGEGPLYTEMKWTLRQMENGLSPQVSYLDLAQRVPLKAISRMCAFLLQNQKRGTGELLTSLMRLKEEVFLERRKRITVHTQQIPQKLLLPSAMLFIGILIVILAPILLGFVA